MVCRVNHFGCQSHRCAGLGQDCNLIVEIVAQRGRDRLLEDGGCRGNSGLQLGDRIADRSLGIAVSISSRVMAV